MNKRLAEMFMFSAAILFFVMASAVFWASVEAGSVLDLPDPLIGLSIRRLFQLVGVAALATSAYLLWSRNLQVRLVVLTWLSLNMLVYHVGMRWYGAANLFACLGNLSVGFPLSPGFLHSVISIVLTLLVSGSGGLLVFNWLRMRQKRSPMKSAAISCEESSQAAPAS